MATIEEMPEEGQVTGNEPIPTLVTIETIPSTSSHGQEESTDPTDMRPNFPVEMMPSMGISEQSLTTGLIAVKPPAVEIEPAQASLSSTNEEVDYSGSDVDWNNVRPSPYSSKFSHLATDEMEIISMEGNLWFNYTFFYSLY